MDHTWISVWGLLVAAVGRLGAITVDYFPTKCNGKMNLLTSHQLESSIGLNYNNSVSCTFTVTAPENKIVLAKFQRFDFESKLNGSCVDFVNIFDGSDATSTQLNTYPLCGIRMPSNYKSSGRSLTVAMETDDTGVRQGFALMFTAVYEGPCSGSDFACNNSLCIDDTLRCNDLDQCGDNSDESTCSAQDILQRYAQDNAGMIVGIVVGVLILGIIVVVLSVQIYKRNKWRRFLNENDAEDESIWEIESAYPVTDRYFKGTKGRPNYNTLKESADTEPAVTEYSDVPAHVTVTSNA